MFLRPRGHQNEVEMLKKLLKRSGEKREGKKGRLTTGPGPEQKEDPKFRREIIGPNGKRSYVFLSRSDVLLNLRSSGAGRVLHANGRLRRLRMLVRHALPQGAADISNSK